MGDAARVEALGEHRYVVHGSQDGDPVDVWVYATPAVIDHVSGGHDDESAVVEAAVSWLLARQRVDELPPNVDLDDVVAAYPQFETDLRTRFTGAG